MVCQCDLDVSGEMAETSLAWDLDGDGSFVTQGFVDIALGGNEEGDGFYAETSGKMGDAAVITDKDMGEA